VTRLTADRLISSPISAFVTAAIFRVETPFTYASATAASTSAVRRL